MSAPLKIVYLAGLADSLGLREEHLDLPAGVTDVASLQAWLIARGETWELLGATSVRLAVNHQLATGTHPLQSGDEVAFFPPVTGG